MHSPQARIVEAVESKEYRIQGPFYKQTRSRTTSVPYSSVLFTQ